jgi:4-amino-4-deoxy-L-arabinose transferase-like glycosyltransferase
VSETEVEPNETSAVVEPSGADTPAVEPTTPTTTPSLPATFTRTEELRYGMLAMLAGYGGAFLLMSNAEQVFRGPLYGILLCLLGTVGLVMLVDGKPTGAVRSETERVLGRLPGEPIFMAPIVTIPLALALSIGLLMGLRGTYGFDGAAAVAVLAGLVPLALSAFRRPSLLLAVVVTGIYLPRLGLYPLWDPWETHYGEVSREILSRDDWISLWWSQDGWFFSKPILIFWAEALSMGAFGLDARPDANPPDPEWALRMPIFLMSLGAVLAANALAKRIAGARAGVLAGLVVASMPLFFMISHQAITDMPVVSCMTIAMCLLGLAITEKPDALVEEFTIGKLRWSKRRAALALLAMVGVPQLLYLVSRNITRYGYRFAVHADKFLHGSAGNDGIPGNAPLREQGAAFGHWLLAPAMQAVWWLVLLALVAHLLRRDDKRQAPLMLGFYVFCALGFLAKGIPGFALPGLVALFFLIAAWRFDALRDGELRVGAGILTVLGLGLPWYIAMHIRHGVAFFDRILVHDHINRLASGVHGDNGSLEYFIAQLGYGTFPWVALAPAAVLSFIWYRKRDGAGASARDATQDGLVLVAMWALSSFTLFSAMVTKFHHYIFPVVPPIGILVGILLERTWTRAKTERTEALASVSGVISGGLFAVAIAGLYGNLRGIVPENVPTATSDWVLDHPPAAWITALLFVLSGLGFVLVYALTKDEDDDARVPAGIALVAFGGAALAALVGRDLSWATSARPAGYERLANLYTYKYDRAWPSHIDYRPILTGLAIAATIAVIALAWPKLRAVASRALLGVALAFAAFGVNVYLPDVAPHWSAGPLIARYYHQRGPNEPLLAFQMNWKGENFYTGNRVHVFQELSTAALTTWMQSHEYTSFFVILEPGRVASMRSVSGIRQIRERSTPRDNNKFVLVHVSAARVRPAGE